MKKIHSPIFREVYPDGYGADHYEDILTYRCGRCYTLVRCSSKDKRLYVCRKCKRFFCDFCLFTFGGYELDDPPFFCESCYEIEQLCPSFYVENNTLKKF